MQKQMGSILFVAGTTIGSGVIALPMILAKIGLIPSVFLMLVIWSLMYYTAMVNIELNLQAGKGLPLGMLAKLFSGRISSWIGMLSFFLLSYALLSVFLSGGSSVMQKFISETFEHEYSFGVVTFFCALAAVALLVWPIKYVDYVNRIFFTGKCLTMAVLVIGLCRSTQYDHLPLFTDHVSDSKTWMTVIPVVFTAFGFQVIFHTITNYCDNNPVMIKRAFFWGSLIPAIIYLLWTSSVLIILYHANPDFYEKVVTGKTEIGEIIRNLSQISLGLSIEKLFWWISNLAVVTSIIGVGLGLIDTWRPPLQTVISNKTMAHGMAVIMTIFPAYVATILIPNAFIRVLGFAGMILVIIAILLPIYLLNKSKIKNWFYPKLKTKAWGWICVIVGVGIMLCEIFN